MMRVEIQGKRLTVHVDDHGAEMLEKAAHEARTLRAKVIIGDPGEEFIVRHEGYRPDSPSDEQREGTG